MSIMNMISIVSASDCSVIVELWQSFGKNTTVDPNDQLACCASDIPKVTCNGTIVIKIDWSSLGLTGVIPGMINKLQDLSFLNLGNNLFTEIQSGLAEMKNLTDLMLYSNKFSGSFPSSILAIKSLKALDLSNNKFSGVIPTQISDLHDLQILSLSDNRFSGSIPPGIASLSNLQQLFLTNNLLSGGIPSQLGSLSNLKYLALNGNKLSGNIPCSFLSLDKLIELDFSNNVGLSGAVFIGSSPLSDLSGTGITRLCTPSKQRFDTKCEICGYNQEDVLQSGGLSVSVIWIAMVFAMVFVI